MPDGSGRADIGHTGSVRGGIVTDLGSGVIAIGGDPGATNAASETGPHLDVPPMENRARPSYSVDAAAPLSAITSRG